MTLIKSISGIRGTIGGRPDEGLTPLDVVKYTAAFGTWLKSHSDAGKVVIGRDARISGPMVSGLVTQTLVGLGLDVVDLGLSTTPTVEMAVVLEKAAGGIILTASHNPGQWNALKLLNAQGEFISAEAGAEVLELAGNDEVEFAEVDQLGTVRNDEGYIRKHIDLILELPEVEAEAVRAAGLKVAVDAVNSSGGLAVPALLEAMGVEAVRLYCEPNGNFPHNPEPLPQHLTEISKLVKEQNCDLGIVVDPDVDRLALISENGEPFGEEYTLVAVSDYILSLNPGPSVSNLSSSRALRDVTEAHGQQYFASAVGEVNVVNVMKDKGAVIGGEGNGGIIFPGLHYGRDALVGIALFLSHLVKKGMKTSELRASYPPYFIAKHKIALQPGLDVDLVLEKMRSRYADNPIDTRDGVKIELGKEWVHLRKSNTEPIIRIYTESKDEKTADQLAERIISEMEELINQMVS